MQEIELKFLVLESRLKGLMRQAKVKSSQEIQMAAHYYDTPDQDLAKKGIGLRIRQEGEAWVQTIKAGGDGIAARLEHNITLDHDQVQTMLDGNALTPDLTLYKNTPIAPALSDFKLKKLAKKVTRQYVTDVQRTTRLLEDDNEDSTVEIAYDHGQIIHGKDNKQSHIIQEIEFELVSGELDFLFATAKIWCKRYKLCLSTVTKAERGGLLVKGQDHSPAVKPNLGQLEVDQDSTMPAFLRAAVHNCLLQILPNSSAIVAGSQDQDHVVQLHVGLCRLRAALKAFDSFSDEINSEWLPILRQTATLLSDHHKMTYLAENIEPMLAQYGAPSTDWDAHIAAIKVTPIDAVRANDFQITLLELIAFAMSDPSIDIYADKRAIDNMAKILSKKYEKLLQAEQRVEEVSTIEFDSSCMKEANNKLRYHLKTLRYISEFAAPLYSKKKSKRWLKRVVTAQKALDHYLDASDYQQHYQQKSLIDAKALYGAGWFAATVEHNRDRYENKWVGVTDGTTFW